MRKQTYTKEYLTQLAQKHKNHVTTARHWNQHAKEHNLPRSSVFVERFGSWNAFKESLGVKTVKQYKHPKKAYNKQGIIDIVKRHSVPLQNKGRQKAWEEYRAKHTDLSLPSYATLLNHLCSKEIRELAQGRSGYFTEEELIDIAKQHQEFFKTKRVWDQYAKENNLPTSNSYIYAFSKWSVAKRKILNGP